ncbi:lipase 2 [Coprinopsis cinerea AmutBmut pab1-1]|nr:lipase 2 [Coprinopsis cinerea AmutBmut pab1-1]
MWIPKSRGTAASELAHAENEQPPIVIHGGLVILVLGMCYCLVAVERWRKLRSSARKKMRIVSTYSCYGAITSRREESCSNALDILFITSAFVLLGLVLGVVVYNFRKWFRPQASREWTPRQPWDVSPIRPSSMLETIVGVWMADDVNPKFIHHVSLKDSARLEKLVDDEGYVYVIADPERSLDNQKALAAAYNPILVPAIPAVPESLKTTP